MSNRQDLVSALVAVMERPPSVEAIRQRCTAAEYDEILVLAEQLVARATEAPNPRTGLLALTVALALYDEAYGKLRALLWCDARPRN